MPSGESSKICEGFNKEVLPKMVNAKAMEKVRWHLENGHEVVLVSANFELLLSAWCNEHSISLISTCLEVKNGKLTGKFSSNNCYGEEKVTRVKQHYKIEDYSNIYAYGDSKGDLPMLDLAHHRFFKPFRD
ncbi:HAD-IB family hydrolase [Cytophagaceae bacterium ABcell3]|nr:HAD-IB family hydrolase [Cytophagaceae bacterium ABcell3]